MRKDSEVFGRNWDFEKAAAGYKYPPPLEAVLLDSKGREVETRFVLVGALTVQRLEHAGHGLKRWVEYSRSPLHLNGRVIFTQTGNTRAAPKRSWK